MKLSLCISVVLLFYSGCAFPTPQAPFSAAVSARVDEERHLIEWQVIASEPLIRAKLLLGVAGARAALDAPVPGDSAPLVFRYPIPPDGLVLAGGLSELRYGWELTGSSGTKLRTTGVVSSSQLIADHSAPAFEWQEVRDGDVSLFYLPGTPAARDIEALRTAAKTSLARDVSVLGASLSQPLAIYLLPRIFWQGGAAFGDRIIIITYADRAVTGVSPQDYLTHEIAHALTQGWGNLANAGGMLSEGIAVYATGGHYQPDRLDRSAATLARGPLFISPAGLRLNFSNLQHEVAYTESGSFVKFLVDEYGLERLKALVRRPNDWKTIYGSDVDALSRLWLDRLNAIPADETEVQRWSLKVRFFDLLRRYEERVDPDARRLPSVPVARWDDGLRKAMRAPAEAEENQALELMLGNAIDLIDSAPSANHLDTAAENLDEIERRISLTASADGPVLAEVRSIVRLARQQSDLLLARDWRALRGTLDDAGHPLFAAHYMAQAQAQPLWLRFRLTPVRLVVAGSVAYLGVAQWTEPLDNSTKATAPEGERWVLALEKQSGEWRVTGRWPESPELLLAQSITN